MYKFFVDRPVFAMVLAILTVIVGLVVMSTLPITQYPNMVPPQISVTATYPGADAETVANSVASPIEQSMAGVEGMTYQESTSSNNGRMGLTVNFEIGTEPDIDQILTQLRTDQANPQLPQSVREQGITVEQSLASPLMVISLTSPDGSRDSLFLGNYAVINLNDAFTRINGISRVVMQGVGDYAMRVWIDPTELAARGLTVSEVINTINEQNQVNPAGKIGAQPVPPGQEYTYTVQAQGRLKDPREFEKIILRLEDDGSVLRLGDVARVELGASSYGFSARYNGNPSAVLILYQSPGSNALKAAQDARDLLGELSANFPDGMAAQVSLDTTKAVSAGVEEVVKTLLIALVLVLLVVFLFLQGFRATLIPAVAVPVALIGTFILFPVLGFTINTLSLFGLVLAIGLVVDDAIVVVEAVERQIENGLAPREATLKAMSEVSGPIAATSVILAAVFIPTVFLPGITGQLYQQFAVTIAVSVLISSFNALTLSPALAALLLRPKKKEGRGPLAAFFRWFNRVFERATNGYVAVCGGLVRKTFLAVLALLVAAVAAWFTGAKLPSGFIPQEDQGYLFATLTLPPASSLERTEVITAEAEKELMAIPGVDAVTSVSGYNLLTNVQSSYNAFFFVTLTPWSERYSLKNISSQNLLAIYGKAQGELGGIIGASSLVSPPPAVPGLGSSGGVNFALRDRQSRGPQFLAEQVRTMTEALEARPEVMAALSFYRADIPQYYADVDRAQVLRQDVPLDTVYQTLQTFLGGAFVNYFNRFGRQWQVYMQAEPEFRQSAEDLQSFYVLNREGDTVPLSSFTTFERRQGPEYVKRYDLFPSASFNVVAASGYSTGEVMGAIETIAGTKLPPGTDIAYSGLSFEQRKAAEGVPPAAIFGLSLVFAYLILAALYESWSLPFSVLLSLPVAILGAFLFLFVRGFEDNIYTQIGLILLIGLAAKNAILIVEYARQQKEQEGLSIRDAALTAARLRLRPILMTSIAFILGCVPLAIALGAGMVSRQILGTAVIGGMVFATGIAIFLIPAIFALVERIIDRTHRHHGGDGSTGNPS